MLKQDVPLRTGWFGYRKLDVENCIAHIRAAYAAELRLARQTQQGMEETMAQLRQENKALRQRFAQQAAAQAAASVRAGGQRQAAAADPQAGSGPRRDPPLPDPAVCLRAPDDRSAAGKCRPRSSL